MKSSYTIDPERPSEGPLTRHRQPMEDLTDEELMAWFQGRTLPQGDFRINAYTTTDDLTNWVGLAIGSLKRDKSMAHSNLLAVKAILEAESNP